MNTAWAIGDRVENVTGKGNWACGDWGRGTVVEVGSTGSLYVQFDRHERLMYVPKTEAVKLMKTT